MSVKSASSRRCRTRRPVPSSLREAALERALADERARLERATAEFAAFTQAASHDLQAPLHKIAAFGELLRGRLAAGGTDEESLAYLGRMQAAAAAARVLVEDLLMLARVTTKGAQPRECDAAAVAREALAEVSTKRAPLDARVEFGLLPPVVADPAQLRQLFFVLLDNAVKFRRPGTSASVAVSGREIADAGLVEYTVSDAGIGFDERWLDRIFLPFQRLHGPGEYPGTGIGLALASKIVARHGGSLTASSGPGGGASFVARMPRRPISAPS